MTKITCIAIDDEPLALAVIERFSSKVPSLELRGTFQNPLSALEFLQSHPVDLLFLDIHMPDLSGMEFLHSLTHKPLIIFTTAHTEYALESYEWDAVDYLLKPILFERFLKGVNKARHIMDREEDERPATQEATYLFVKSDTRFFKINYRDILFIEGMRDYIAIHTEQQRILTLMSMTKMLHKLPSCDFKRVHKSYIINVQHIDLIQHNRVQLAGKEIPVSSTYKEDFQKFIESRLE